MSKPAAIAVVGLGCWYPGARNPRELWENVLARRQQFRAFLEERMPAADYFDASPDAPDKTYGTLGAFIDGFQFDPTAWRVPRQSFVSADITHWLALEVAAQALADAGYARGEGLPLARTGVILGNSLTGEQARANSMRLRWPFVRRVIAAELGAHLPASQVDAALDAIGARYQGHFPATNEDTLAGALSNTIAGRICGMFDFGGGGYVVDGACASGLLAVCTAASALEDGRVDACLAGGVDVSLDPFELVGFAKARALTPTDMRVYDKRGNGFIPGEGCGFVVLKRLEDARASGDRVYAVLQGWGVASDGRSAITAPKVEGQARAIRTAWDRSGIPDFVEGHGTGTTLGDRVELEAIATATGAAMGGERRVGVTSLKSILGHTKAAAGIGAFLKAVMAANRRVLPPTAGCEDPNAVFSGPARALYPLRRGAVRAPDAVVRAGASAMGFGGIDAHAVVVSADGPDERLAPALSEAALLAHAQEAELFVLAANSRAELRAAAATLAQQAAGIARGELVDLSAACLSRLGSGRCRAAVRAANAEELVSRLGRISAVERADGPEIWVGEAPQDGAAPRIGFVFPGQGAQEPGMAQALLARQPALAATARAWASSCPALWDALYPDMDRLVDPAEVTAARTKLADTRLAQPALALTAALWVERLAQLNVSPCVVAGHSLGELCAMAAGGMIDAPTLLRLAARRGLAMAAPANRPAGMSSLVTDAETAAALCANAPGYAAVANINSPRQVVVAGEIAALDAIEAAAQAQGISFRRLSASNGFHSALVADAAATLAADEAVPLHGAAPTVLVLSSLQAAPLDGASLRAHVAAHVRAPVDFAGLVGRLGERADLLIEVGSGRVLSGLIEANHGPRCLPVESAPNRADLDAVLAAAWVRGAAIRWSALHQGRLVRPFVPRTARVFLGNPCEAGREPAPVALERPPAAPIAAPTVARPAPERAPTEAPREAATTLRWMLARVAEKTGFDLASLSPEQRLQDDLNLDSIKAGELVAATARHLGVADRVDPALYLREPLGSIAAALSAVASPAAARPTMTARQELTFFLNNEIVGDDSPAPHAPTERSEGCRRRIGRIPPGGRQAPRLVGIFGAGEREGFTPRRFIDDSLTPAAPPAARWTRTFGLTVIPASPAASAWTGARVRVLGANVAQVEAALMGAGAVIDPHGPDVVAVLAPGPTAARVAALREVVEALSGARSLLIVQRLDGRFGLSAVGTGAAGAAFARSISLERPALAVAVVDLAPGVDWSALAAERPVQPGFCGVGIDAEGRWSLVSRPLPPAPAPRAAPLRAGELVLVTGGARGITAACAEALARQTGVRLALVGSTPVHAADEEIVRLLGRLSLAGIEARYYACDLADAAAVTALVTTIQAAQGPIAALVHGAGRNQPRRVEQVSAAEALAEIAPKLLGAEALLAAFEAHPPRMVVGLTSIIGVSGMPGNAWYAFANEHLDLLLADFAARHPGCAPLSLAYGVWAEIGMGAKLGSVPVLAKMGIGALEPAEGVARFLALMAGDPGVRQPIITAHIDGLPTWPAAALDVAGLRYLDGARSGVPGVEARVRLRLDPERDAYLRDHDFQGSLLLPTVFGLEAMTQAACLARGEVAPVAEIRDIELPAPVVVDEQGTHVELRATVDEADPSVVRASVWTEATGFARPHFAATFHFGRPPAAAPVALPTLPAPEPALDPRRDLYGGLLFQGPRFHRMGAVLGGAGRQMVFTSEAVAPQGERWLLGDPFLRDALLQAGQVLVAQDDALPVRIARIRFAEGAHVPGPRLVHAQILASTAQRHTGAVVVLVNGEQVEQLEGYEVQILAHHPARPDTEAIFRPDPAALHALHAQLRAACPSVALQLVAQPIQALPRPARREAVRPLIAALAPAAHLSWSAEGRPALSSGQGVSVAHDDHSVLVAVAPGAVGVDVEPVVARDWAAVLHDRARLLAPLRAGGDSLSEAGARIWVAGEALYKAGAGLQTPTLIRRDGAQVHLRLGDYQVITLPFCPPRGPRRMVAVAVGPVAAPVFASAPALTPAIDPSLLGVRLVNDQMVTRFVVSFEESSSLSGKVPATTLSTWMGRLRELALAGLRGPILASLASGQHGMVTQSAAVRLTGEASALDRIEATTWVEDLRPSTCLLRFAFARITDDGRAEPVGEASQRFGWVEVLSHGVVRAASFPTFLYDFLARIRRPDSAAPPPPLVLPVRPELARISVATTLVDSNVVGNLYYANYFKWAQRVLDQWLWRNTPETFTARGARGELQLTGLRLEFLREAMPFDEIEVMLHPAGDQEFDVVFHRREADGTRTRLAIAHIEARWCAGLRVPVWAPGEAVAK